MNFALSKYLLLLDVVDIVSPHCSFLKKYIDILFFNHNNQTENNLLSYYPQTITGVCCLANFLFHIHYNFKIIIKYTHVQITTSKLLKTKKEPTPKLKWDWLDIMF
jgi:hypothetical protein